MSSGGLHPDPVCIILPCKNCQRAGTVMEVHLRAQSEGGCCKTLSGNPTNQNPDPEQGQINVGPSTALSTVFAFRSPS